VALDYNAAFTASLARMAREYGGTPVAGFPRAETPDTELFVQASLNQANTNFVEIKSLVYNHTAFPARYTPNLSYRYYFTLDAGTTPSQIVLTKAYAQCADPTGPTQFAGNVYYVTISCVGQNLGPIGQSESRRENQFRITFPSAHDHTKDWSFAGISTTQSTPTDATHIVLLDGTRQVWGTPPGPAATPPTAPGKPTASNITATGATLTWTASTPGTNPIGGYEVWRVATGGDVKVTTVTGLTATVAGLAPSTTYTFYIKAVDNTGVASNASASTPVTTLTARGPTAPGTPSASNVTSSSVTLTWTASTAGDFPVQRYEVFAGATPVGQTASTTLNVTGLSPSTTYSFSVLARDTAGVPSPNSAPVSVTTLPGPAATLKAQYKNNDSAPTDNQIKPGLTLVNGGATAVSLSTVTIRYYFTAEAGSTSYNTWCDHAQVGCANLTLRVVALATPVAGADRYLEVSFTAGSLAAGASLGEIQCRFNKSDWSAFSETNDYSYATNTAFADSTKVTVFVGGQLVWGTPPA
jgi:chitodextrinase